jgi:hypothetical protein
VAAAERHGLMIRFEANGAGKVLVKGFGWRRHEDAIS